MTHIQVERHEHVCKKNNKKHLTQEYYWNFIYLCLLLTYISRTIQYYNAATIISIKL